MAPIPRNQLCPCGSGKKYKKCCLNAVPAPPVAQADGAAGDIDAALKQAVALQQSGQGEAADALLRGLVAQHPGQSDAWHLLGLSCYRRRAFAEAIAHVQQAIEINPKHPVYPNNLGVIYKDDNRFEAAVAAFQQAIALASDYAEAYNNLGTVLKAQGAFLEAVPAFRQAIRLNPQSVEAYSNLGSTYKDLADFVAAEHWHRAAIALDPNYSAAYNNLGRVFEAQNRTAEAIDCYRKAIALDPEKVDLQHNLSLLLLVRGEFLEGWRHYESRFHPVRNSRNTVPPKVPFPRWQGEDLNGKSLLVWKEQGFGDEIQFCRYVPLLKHRGARHITWVCKPPLKPLLQTLPGLDLLLSDGETFARHDFWTFPLSLPHVFGTTLETLPVFAQYLWPLPERVAEWQTRWPAGEGLRVGLVWKGAKLHQNDANRSLAHLSLLSPLLSVPGVQCVSLQKGQGEEEAAALGVPDLAAGIRDFADTAAIVAQLDLLIAVDTAVVHLAGALGKPVWVMLPFAPDWRWLQDRSDSPWYPNTRLFRQPAPGDWASVIAQVKQALSAKAT